MSEPATAPVPAKKPIGSFFGMVIVPVGLIAIAGLVFLIYYLMNQPEKPVDSSKVLNGYLTDANKYQTLSADYTDADGDLLADPPAADKLLDPAELVFSDIASDDPDKAEASWKPFLEHLQKATGKPCKYLKEVDTPLPPASTPPEVDAADAVEPSAKGGRIRTFTDQLAVLKEGKLHVTAFSTGQVRWAVNAAGFVPLYAPADTAGKASYEMEVIVPAASAAKTVADLKGKKVGFVALSSNSGAKAPIVLLQEQFQLNPRTDYQIVLTGSHEQSMKRVAAGELDGACVANDLLKREVAAGRAIQAGQYRSIYTSQPFPKLCFGVTHRLKPDLAAKVKAAFESFAFAGNSVGEKYAADGATHFQAINYKKDWEGVRDIDDKLIKILSGK